MPRPVRSFPGVSSAIPQSILHRYSKISIEDHSFLVNIDSGVALQLNPSAEFLYDELIRSTDVTQMITDLAEVLELERTALESDVLQLLCSLENLGLEPDETETLLQLLPVQDFQESVRPMPRIKRVYCMANHSFRVEVPSFRAALHLDAVMPGGRVQQRGTKTEIRLVRGRSCDCIFVDDEPFCAFSDPSHGVNMVRDTIHKQLCKTIPDSLLLHAGAIGTQTGEAILCIAPSGHGKTSLVVSLALSGFHYLGDDVQLLSLSQGTIHALPTAANLKAGSFALFEDVLPEIKRLPTYAMTTRPVKYLKLPVENEMLKAPLPVSAIVFPNYDAGAIPSVLKMGPQQIFPALYESGVYATLDESVMNTQRCLEFFLTRPCYELHYPSSGEATRLLTEAGVI